MKQQYLSLSNVYTEFERFALQYDGLSVGGGNAASNLLALYRFNEGSGNVVYDSAGAADLTIADVGAVTWQGDGLKINSETSIATATATAITDACKLSNAITVEVWVTPLNITQGGPARIAALHQGSTFDIAVGQAASRFDTRLRTSSISTLRTDTGFISGSLQHLVFIHSGQGLSVIYIDGQAIISEVLSGDFSTWTNTFGLTVGNMVSGSAQFWRGTLHALAIYDRALSGPEIAAHYLAGYQAADFLLSGGGVLANEEIEVLLNLLELANFREVWLDGDIQTPEIKDLIWALEGKLLGQ